MTTFDHIREAYREYTDPDELVQNKKNPPVNASGNGWRHTCEFLILMWDLAESPLARSWVEIHFRSLVIKHSIVPGLIKRSRDNYDAQTVDDYTAIISAASIFKDEDTLEEIAEYARESWWSFIPSAPYKFTFKTCLYRHLVMVSMLKISMTYLTNKSPSRFWLAISFFGLRTAYKKKDKGQDEWVLTYLAFRGLPVSRTTHLYKMWCKHFRESEYQGNFGKLFEKYFNDPNHPHARFMHLVEL